MAMQGSASRQAIITMVISIASLLTCCLPLGVVGLVLGKVELTAIAEGRAPRAGATFAKIGFYLGMISTGISGISYIIGALFN